MHQRVKTIYQTLESGRLHNIMFFFIIMNKLCTCISCSLAFVSGSSAEFTLINIAMMTCGLSFALFTYDLYEKNIFSYTKNCLDVIAAYQCLSDRVFVWGCVLLWLHVHTLTNTSSHLLPVCLLHSPGQRGRRPTRRRLQAAVRVRSCCADGDCRWCRDYPRRC